MEEKEIYTEEELDLAFESLFNDERSNSLIIRSVLADAEEERLLNICRELERRGAVTSGAVPHHPNLTVFSKIKRRSVTVGSD